MFLKALYLRNFRNFAEAEITFSPQQNYLYGDNAQGKTNILEAISLVTTGRSFRTTYLQELIRTGEAFFFVEGIIHKDGFDHKIQIAFDGKVKKLTLDGNSYGNLQHLLGLLPSVLFTPSDSELVDGSPAVRRRFLNLHLAQAHPLYMHHLARYWRAMKQRNALLRSAEMELDCWEVEMAESAHYLRGAREGLLSSIQDPLKKHSLSLSSGKEAHEVKFQSATPPLVDTYLAQLKKNRSREKQLGMTLTGPHRDDFALSINNHPSRGFSSEGQKKTAAFSLRLAEWELLSQIAGGPALFGIDDLDLHLDRPRLSLFRDSLQSLGQVFITSPHPPPGPGFLVSNGTILHP